ncbi:MAG: C4-dicarboxylate transporter DctA [Acidobacteriota bacterium]
MTEERAGRKSGHSGIVTQVIVGIVAGILLGYFYPNAGTAMKPLGDGFIKLIKMIIGPIIFVTVVGGLCRMSSLKDVGRIGVRALIYFEVASTIANLMGLGFGLLLRPGQGFNADPAAFDPEMVSAYTGTARELSVVGFVLDIIPRTVVDAFAEGHILQVMLFSVLFGLALLKVGDKAKIVADVLEGVSTALFAALRFIMYLAPLGTFGAMAFTVGAYGITTLMPLAKVVFTVYFGCAVFTLVILGGAARLAGFRVLKFLAYIKQEVLIVLAVSTSEVVLPPLMKKLEQLGCPRSVVGLVTPTGYSFNQDGGAVYQVVSVLFIAQAMNITLGWTELLTFMLVLQVTSKGGAGVAGSAFVVLAATIASLQTVPVAGMALLLGVERFMSMARATMNVIGNGVATLFVAWWEGSLDAATMRRELRMAPGAEAA